MKLAPSLSKLLLLITIVGIILVGCSYVVALHTVAQRESERGVRLRSLGIQNNVSENENVPVPTSSSLQEVNVGVENNDKVSENTVHSNTYNVIAGDLVFVDGFGNQSLVMKDIAEYIRVNDTSIYKNSRLYQVEVYAAPAQSDFVYLINPSQSEGYGIVYVLNLKTKTITIADWIDNSLQGLGVVSPDAMNVFAVSKDGKHLQLYSLYNNQKKDIAFLKGTETYISQSETEIGSGPIAAANRWLDPHTIEISVFDRSRNNTTIMYEYIEIYKLKETRTIMIK